MNDFIKLTEPQKELTFPLMKAIEDRHTTETGFISQNVYLYRASAGLNTAIIGLVNRDKLHETMGLNDYEKVIYSQAIG
ncbi:MAG: nitroreductase family protein [Marinilabiliaceae bacterium]|nr:nitroreductase family protein [Marinilabiliaceae bacterium]